MSTFGAVLFLAAAAATPPPTDRETYAGLPRAGEVTVLRNPGFVVGYSDARRQPLWVAYRAETLKGTRPYRRLRQFEADTRLARPVQSRDYAHSGFTRGHLAPAYLIGRLFGPEAQRATHLMSNVSPQTARLNELVWERLETAEVSVAPAAVLLWVVTGPLFNADPALLKNDIAVPVAFYRIWLDLQDGAPRVLAFIVPQAVCGTEPLSRYLASVDEVERRSGLDFFHELDDALENGLERESTAAGWGMERWEKRPPHFAKSFGKLECGTG